MLFMTICEIVFPLFFATEKSENYPYESIDDLCGGSIEVVIAIECQAFGFILYFIGAVSFISFSKHIEPQIYFKQFIPISCYISIGLLLPLHFYNLFSLLNQVIVIFFAVIPQFVVKYNSFYSVACIDQKICWHSDID